MINPNHAPQQTIVEILRSKKLTVSAEVIPPRNGADPEMIYAQIDKLKNAGVDFIAVTKGAGGSLRGGTLPIAQLIRTNFGVTSLAHFTCRDFTKEEIENHLMDHHYFGIRNILALRGDPPDGQPHYFQAKENRHSFAWQLVEQIRAMNEGKYLVREGFDEKKINGGTQKKGEPTAFCIGAAAHPEQRPLEQSIEFFEKKIQAGAEFGITQMIFSDEHYRRFCEILHTRKVHVPVLPGIRILTSHKTALRMREKFLDVTIPDALIDALARAEKSSDPKMAMRNAGLQWANDLCGNLLKAGAPGIHVFVMTDTEAACELIQTLRA